MENKNEFARRQQYKQNAVVKVVTMDPKSWSRNQKHRWILYLGLAISIILLLGSCKNGKSEEAGINPADTIGLAAFKAQQATDSLNMANMEDGSSEAFMGEQGGQQVEDEQNWDNEPSGAIKSINDQEGSYASDQSSGGASSEVTNDEGSQAYEPQSSEEPTTKKKRFSNASKGALIGAGSGAVIGAVISKKNRGLGAVIGAAVGGGAGYGIGKHKDNKQANGE